MNESIGKVHSGNLFVRAVLHRGVVSYGNEGKKSVKQRVYELVFVSHYGIFAEHVQKFRRGNGVVAVYSGNKVGMLRKVNKRAAGHLFGAFYGKDFFGLFYKMRRSPYDFVESGDTVFDGFDPRFVYHFKHEFFA